MRGPRAWPLVVAALLVACSGGEPSGSGASSAGSSRAPTTQPPAATSTPAPSPTPTATQTATPTPAVFDAAIALGVIEHLATRIGPREGSSPAFHQAAVDVQGWFTALGYTVTQAPVPVPAGNSWGVDVPAGTSANVVADPPGFDPAAPHVVVGAHLDTVPQAPGAEDNASGVGVLFALARMAVVEPPAMPVRFVAFGAEEPRGDGDALHHFGSQQYVRDLPAAERAALLAMVSLDRVGVAADIVPVCTGGRGTTAVRDALVQAAATVAVVVETCENRSSDHWSFEKGEIPSARLGSIPYPGYHSAQDVPSVVDPTQLDKVGRVMWAWLTSV